MAKKGARKKAAKKTRARKPTRSADPPDPSAPATVSLRAFGASAVDFTVTPAEAMRWSGAVLNRRRWASDERTSARQSEAAREALSPPVRAMLDGLDGLDGLGEDGLLEVHAEHESEQQSWPARVFPWEYVLTAARVKSARPMTVMRSISAGRRKKPKKTSSSEVLLYVESAPQGLRAEYDFKAERVLVQRALGIDDGDVSRWDGKAGSRSKAKRKKAAGARAGDRAYSMVILEDPDEDELGAAVEALAPEIVHLTGFDSHQGMAVLRKQEEERRRSTSRPSETTETPAATPDVGELEPTDEPVLDGYVVRAGSEAVVLPAEALAGVLCRATEPPGLVGFNLYHSGSRSAALTVAEGAGAAVGFLDDFDDSLTERLFADVYSAWRFRSGGGVEVFRWAFDQQRSTPGALRGTSLVFYVRGEILSSDGAGARLAKEREALRFRLGEERGEIIQVTDELASILSFDIKPYTEINYALLHNNRPLFEKFDVVKHKEGRLRDLEIDVQLHLGQDSPPYRCMLDVVNRVTPLTDKIRVPLTSSLARAVRESVRTSLFVEVSTQGRVLLRQTHPIWLLSANEWRDTKTDGVWLPSFVLPRDPAVARIIDSAQRYLMAIADEPAMGFDGYQSVDPEADDPYELVDAQVRAIWSALVHEHALSYINPPPTYSAFSQRIRTPSEILEGRRGTCIDLALLFAACLEYVEIYPAIFLLTGHCFPGYWRSEDDHEAFLLAQGSNAEGDQGQGRARDSQTTPWHSPRSAFAEIKSWMRSGSLVPLEAVWLTTRESFWSSCVTGEENLSIKREFDSMLDVMRARAATVTPLPIREERS